MKFKLPTSGPEEEVQMAPMIDMVFLLLIFFMVAAHFNVLERVEIKPPVAKHAAIPEDPKDRRTISIKEDGTIYVGMEPRELEEVQPIVERVLEQVPHLKIFLRADRNVPHKRVREVMKACAEAGVVEIIFATYESEPL
jgi:biopolymer transport protein ExbD